ncbi:MAG: HNH endonuclease signature motif containing protein, partial [Actinomycetota bacterium]
DCVLQKVLLAPSGAVLDLGRTVRTATPAQRRALHARDRGCIWPGCTVPARWTDVHHVTAWIHGGATDVASLALLCGAHHAMVEHGHYRIVMIDGVPHVIPPPWIDAHQTPVANTYWRDQDRARHTGRQLALALDIHPRARPPDTG